MLKRNPLSQHVKPVPNESEGLNLSTLILVWPILFKFVNCYLLKRKIVNLQCFVAI